eukprot:722734-Rhodomonas_salina.5
MLTLGNDPCLHACAVLGSAVAYGVNAVMGGDIGGGSRWGIYKHALRDAAIGPEMAYGLPADGSEIAYGGML